MDSGGFGKAQKPPKVAKVIFVLILILLSMESKVSPQCNL